MRRRFRYTIVVVTLVLLFVAIPLPSQENEPLLPAIPRVFVTLPVLFEGRVMPLESAAGLILYRLAGRRSFSDLSATQWLLRLLIDPFSAIQDEVILVDNPAVFPAIGFGEAERGRYAYADLYPGMTVLREIARTLSGASNLDSTEQEIVRLTNNVALFEGLASTFDVYRRTPVEGSTETVISRFLAGQPPEALDTSELPGMLRLFPIDGADEVLWLTPPSAVAALEETPELLHVREMLDAWNTVFPAYLLGDEASLASGAERLVAAVRAAPVELPTTAVVLESLHSRLAPTRWAGRLLLLSLLLFAVLHKSRKRIPWSRVPVAVAAVLLTAHQVIRFLITFRPPVTDLPASFQFVAWLIVLTGLVLTFSRAEVARVGLLLASAAGFGLIYLSRLVNGGADVFGVVQAVLDTNFWLTTHVLVITAGYAGVVAAGVAGHIYLFGTIFRPHRSTAHQTTHRVMFVLLLAGLALSFLGTILGGVWADQSWGRFWGWDPKENGALLIVLWASIALHARVTRWFDQAAFAAASVFGVVVVLFSWLGVNMMGVGLHSYGFSDASFIALVGLSAVELIVAVGGWALARFAKPQPGLHRASIESIEHDGDAALITVRGTNGHLPGQHVGLKTELFDRVRAFSFVDTDPERIRFLIAGSGPLSGHLVSRARAGDPLWMSEASGDFLFSTPRTVKTVMVAGGVGIAPIVGLARQALQNGNPATLVLANRDHTYLDEEVSLLTAHHPGFQVIRILSQPPDGWSGHTGRISTDRLRTMLQECNRSGRGADWYICGSPGFCDTARAAAQALAARRIHEEPFTEAIDPPQAPSFSARIRINSGDDGRLVSVRSGQTILAAALDHGITIPHSCMSGTCRECGCEVLHGTAVQGARPREAEQGDRLLTCVAYPSAVDGLEVRTGDPSDTAGHT